MVSVIAFGTMGLTGTYGRVDPKLAVRALSHALDVGMNFIDTADTYGWQGDNESLVGEVVARRRGEVFLATKFGGGGTDPSATGKADPDLVAGWLDASLRRLGVDHVDLYYLHRVDPVTPIEAVVGAMAALVQSGKVSHIGLSEVSPEIIRRANAVHHVTAVQTEYSIFTRHVEREVLDVCRALDIGFVAYAPLSRGLLAGAVSAAGPSEDDARRLLPRFREAALTTNLALAQRVATLAQASGCTSAQLCLAWLLQQDASLVPLVGSTNPTHIDEDWDSLNLNIDATTMALLSATIDPEAVAGERYSEDRISRVYQ